MRFAPQAVPTGRGAEPISLRHLEVAQRRTTRNGAHRLPHSLLVLGALPFERQIEAKPGIVEDTR